VLHLDAWIEACIAAVAASSRPNQLKQLQDVSSRLHTELRSISDHDSKRIAAFLNETLPGEREMIRRAARRMVVLPRQSLAVVIHTADEYLPSSCSLVLTQNKGRIKLLTLSDVSHAKGDIEISLGPSSL
jgi:hypothetical protein